MATPRAALRVFLTKRFETLGRLRRFVRDNFEEIVPELSEDPLAAMAETFIGGLTERGLIPDLWPILRAERPNYLQEIAKLETSWIAAASGSPIVSELGETDEAGKLDRQQLKAIFASARKAKLERSRRALLVGIPEHIVRALPTAGAPEARLWIDLDRLNHLDGDPAPLELWLDNALLILPHGVDGSGFEQALAMLKTPAARKADEADELYEDEASGLEAIVLPEARPALLVENGLFELPAGGAWRDPLYKARPQIHEAIAATGRLNVGNHPSVPWLGSAFVVGDDIVCTARHNVDFAYSNGRWKDSPSGSTISLAWSPSGGADASTHEERTVTEVLLVHPVLDIAFLHVPGASDLAGSNLVLAHQKASKDELLARITYVGQDSRVDMALQQRVFRGLLDGRKWVLPGKVMDLEEGRQYHAGQKSRNPILNLAYDSSTLGGTSGSPVIELESGLVYGVGYARVYLKANWAVPASEILRDPRVRDLGIALPDNAPDADDPWKDAWDALAAAAKKNELE